MAKLLLTGARSPVALELARNLHRHGHQVVVVDSLEYPLARNSKSISRFYRIPSPRDNIANFKIRLISILKQEKVDYLIPTCEEVFYISSIQTDLETICPVLCSNFDFISRLHSKIEILSLCKDMNVALPHTQAIDKSNLETIVSFDKKIVKKEFCRFGTDVILNPTRKSVEDLVINSDGRFLLQEKIIGKEYCTYAIAHNGVVFADAIYEPTHRVRVGAGIYFNPVANNAISTFVIEFCKKHNYTGQIGFDVMVSGESVYIIECNPRATSGVHLLREADLYKALTGKEPQTNKQSKKSGMISLAMLLIDLPLALLGRRFRQWKSDYSSANDVITFENDNSFVLFQFLSLMELIFISLKNNISIRKASTIDIEWDGEEINNSD